jgi:hypothetical protein
MAIISKNGLCQASVIICLLSLKCLADDVVETSIEEDKPACVEETRYVPVGDGSNVLKTSFLYFAVQITNAQGEVIKKVELPKRLASHLSSTNPFLAPAGESILLGNAEEAETDLQDLGHPIISQLKLYPFPHSNPEVRQPHQLPKIYLRSPRDGITTHPMIEISGFSDQPMSAITYDVLNDSQRATNQHGLINDEFYDEKQFRFTTNYFDCDDINLSPGTNIVLIHCHYPFGKVATLKRFYVLRLDLKTNAPQFKVTWPNPNRQVSGNNISIRGMVDDISANVTGEIVIDGKRKRIDGQVERNGRFWLEHVPLVTKNNLIKITVTDVVGNSSSTNLTIVKSDDQIVINPVPVEQLWQLQVTVSGKVAPPNRNVWVNGLQANVDSGGGWIVKGVRLSKEGVAIFNALALPLTERPVDSINQTITGNSEVRPVESASIKAVYAPTEIILNASQPTYGTFKIHLAGTTGHSFVIQSSTNLIDWAPVVTNLNSSDTFDYYDTNVVTYGCRFFRVVPIH